MARKHRQRSLGEMISSVCFYAVGIYFLLEGNLVQDEGADMIKALGLWGAGIACVMAGARFLIADVVTRLWRRQK